MSFIDKINVILNALPDDEPDSFQVIYLTPKCPSGIVHSYYSDKKYPLKLQTEQIGHLFNKRRIYFWLICKYPRKRFAIEDVDRCFTILSLFLKKTNTSDGEPELREFYYCKWHKNYGVFAKSRQLLINELLSQDEIGIICFDADDAYADENFVETFKMSLEEKQNNPMYKNYLEFSLIEIMENDWAYNTALDYLRSLPDFEGTFHIFHKHFNLPKDLINHIVSFLDSS
jgi:hypothetical protein